MHLVLVKRLVGLSLSGKRVVRLTDRPVLSMDVKKPSSVLENVVDALVNLKTKSCQQLLHFDVVSPGLLAARILSTLCSTKRHTKRMVLIQCADYQIQTCEPAQGLLAARFLSTLCSTKRHAKKNVLIQCADCQIQICEPVQSLLVARFLSTLCSTKRHAKIMVLIQYAVLLIIPHFRISIIQFYDINFQFMSGHNSFLDITEQYWIAVTIYEYRKLE